ncbi:hypothetical protein HMPREF3160_06620 [Arthrobacter sp. HMSC06H05]|uniref:DUF4031 domain-containing protein n=2 Tax=Pseudoglutamicibacter albus TaxID=98671 RepID=A0A095ZQZ7_9MICC|nr:MULTISPECIES: DUF4031 domain-containing protein [Micrococcaceae]KGF20972.1 hypothetical protein HMPREF2128_02835 [Pseudoglutamicibacter albus DNF00011]MDR7292996.1 putative metal-dependent HD superfamily phosphohydrolase [Pseudoglutamicibacter albus]OFT42001.1 hypothetical protein HMPREF3160_06620 [Arthrobacter sp. HMSC06H05]
MTILIDPPVWPAHGTHFSHVVSDTSLEELHAFAQRAGLPQQAFDHDHYDVPLRVYESLIALGAVPVSAAELTRRLRDSGLRVPARDRIERIETRLASEFERLLPGQAGLCRGLLERWKEPHRRYHDLRHLNQVLASINTIATSSGMDDMHGGRTAVRTARLAAWWHDAVYEGKPGEDEHASAELAAQQLQGVVEHDVVHRVYRAILATADHAAYAREAVQGRGEVDAGVSVLLDADLSVLARPHAGYQRYVLDVRNEYAHVPDEDFVAGRTRILKGMLATPQLYITDFAVQNWEAKARSNIAGELARLNIHH